MVPDPYNLSLMGNATGIVDLMITVNERLMHGQLGVLILVTIFLICIMAFMVATADFGKSLTASSFIMFAMSILLRILNVIPDWMMFGSLAFCAFCVAFFMLTER